MGLDEIIEEFKDSEEFKALDAGLEARYYAWKEEHGYENT